MSDAQDVPVTRPVGRVQSFQMLRADRSSRFMLGRLLPHVVSNIAPALCSQHVSKAASQMRSAAPSVWREPPTTNPETNRRRRETEQIRSFLL